MYFYLHNLLDNVKVILDIMKKSSTNKKSNKRSNVLNHVQSEQQVVALTGIYQNLTDRRKATPKPRLQDLGPATSTGRVQHHS